MAASCKAPFTRRSTISKKLNEEPHGHHKLSVREPQGWLEFDPNGNIIEQGAANESGKVTVLARTRYDAQGKPIEDTFIQGDKTFHYRTETETLPSGSTEGRAFKEDKLIGRVLSTYNPQTGEGDRKRFNQQGQMTLHTITHRSPTSSESETWDKDGTFIEHVLRRYDDKGELIESQRYDALGGVVSDLSFKDSILASWWQDPKCNCTNGAGFHWPDGYAVAYETTRDGKLLKDVQHHKGRLTNDEIDDEELYDENDHLLERIAYTYERDDQGNWIRRVASVLDSNTGIMVPVREDVRKLTYY